MYSNVGISIQSNPIHKGRHIHIHPYPNRLEDHPSISIRVSRDFIHIHPYPRAKWISADIRGYPYPCQSLIEIHQKCLRDSWFFHSARLLFQPKWPAVRVNQDFAPKNPMHFFITNSFGKVEHSCLTSSIFLQQLYLLKMWSILFSYKSN